MVKVDVRKQSEYRCTGCDTPGEIAGDSIEIQTITPAAQTSTMLCFSCASELQYKIETYLRGAR